MELFGTGSKKREPAPKIKYWLGEIDAALSREKDYRKEAEKAVRLFSGYKQPADSPFNVLYSNTETIAPALYNSTPRPEVRRRFEDKDPLAGWASLISERLLAYLLDPGTQQVQNFDSTIYSTVVSALVAGRGSVRYRYAAEFERRASLDPETQQPVEYEAVKFESVYGESVAWNRFLHGYATCWSKVPWAAYEWAMTKDELIKNFGEAVVKKMALENISAQTGAAGTEDGSDAAADGKSGEGEAVPGAMVYEIWDKNSRKVLFVSSCYPDDFLKQEDDPLQLSGFFPSPEPLYFVSRIDDMTPGLLYCFYKQQAEELNIVTIRIKKIVQALKVRGFYDSTVEGIDRVLQAEDNTLISAENVAALQQGQTLDKAIFLMPIEKLTTVLQQLYLQRTQIKQVIYEITGIADIMRGSSQASETLGAQQIKNQWGTLRLKKAQRSVVTFIRDSLRIMLEIAITHFGADTVKSITNVTLPLLEEKQQAQMQLQELQQQMMLLQQQAAMQLPGPGLGQSTEPQPGPQIPPQLQQQMKQLQEVVSKPAVEDVLMLLRDDLQRSFRVDIETNSSIDLEATEDKQDMAEMTNALAQFMNGVAPAVQSGGLPFEAAKIMLLSLVRRFRFGRDVEEVLEKMEPPPPPAPDPAEKEKAAAEAQRTQMELKKAELALQQAQQEHQYRMAEMQQEAELAQQKHALELEKLNMQMQALREKTNAQIVSSQVKAESALQQAAINASAKQDSET